MITDDVTGFIRCINSTYEEKLALKQWPRFARFVWARGVIPTLGSGAWLSLAVFQAKLYHVPSSRLLAADS